MRMREALESPKDELMRARSGSEREEKGDGDGGREQSDGRRILDDIHYLKVEDKYQDREMRLRKKGGGGGGK